MIFNGHKRSVRTCLDVGNLDSVVLLLGYLDAACVYEPQYGIRKELELRSLSCYRWISWAMYGSPFGSVNFRSKVIKGAVVDNRARVELRWNW